jgi:Nuclease-related domain
MSKGHTRRRAVSHPLAMRGAVKVGVAGGSAERKYEDLTRAWRRRMRSRFLLLALGLTPVVGLLVLAGVKWESFRWTSGFLVGCVFAFFVIARMSPPAWIENWQDGAFGEQWTAKSLRPLEERGWVVLHDLPGKRGNLDHVVVGPGGVFLLDSKRWRGSTTVNGDIATVRRVEDPDLFYRLDSVGYLKGLARDVHDRIRAESRVSVWVEPVFVIWGGFPQRVAGETCKFVHGEDLATWLEDQPKRIDASRVDQLALAIDRGWMGRASLQEHPRL